MHVVAPRKRLYSTTIYLFVPWVVGTALLLFCVAALFMRNQVRGIRRLAGAAEAFGVGRDIPPIRPEGATEVRQAAAAFNRMQDRIRRFLAQRTEMLAGVSHDLRTPLTRLRLALAMLPKDEAWRQDVAEMTEDVEEMERMIGGYLAFARGEGTEQAKPIDLSAMLTDVAVAARRGGANIEINVPETLTVSLRADAVKRAITNLVDNARRHAGRVMVSAVPRGRSVLVNVDDDGPGHRRRTARGCVPAVSERLDRRHRAWADDRARHRARAWRRYFAGGFADGRFAGAGAIAGVTVATRQPRRRFRIGFAFLGSGPICP